MGGGACRQGDCSFPPKKITPLPLQNVAVRNIIYKLLRLYLTIPVASATSEKTETWCSLATYKIFWKIQVEVYPWLNDVSKRSSASDL